MSYWSNSLMREYTQYLIVMNCIILKCMSELYAILQSCGCTSTDIEHLKHWKFRLDEYETLDH
jgi:hypothetical protein